MLKLFALLGLVSLSSYGLAPQFTGADATRPRILVALREWARDLPQITDIAFIPGTDRALVLLKDGDIFSLSRSNAKDRVKIQHLDVLTTSELGLLGVALHPGFSQNRKIYLNYNPTFGKRRTRVSEWVLPADTGKPEKERVLLEFLQPYPNHNGGALVFGPDGMLYIGTGDGGDAGDPHDNGQKPSALLGKMLRIDVDGRGAARAYGIPRDNPFVLDKKYAPEIWAIGLRNPWRYSFDPRGRLIVADVGQNRWEEVSIVEAGKNYGWHLKEGTHCFKPDKGCASKGLSDPWLEYGREDGASVTGGFVYRGDKVPDLKGKYLFGDFVSGRIWAADLPALGKESVQSVGFYALGKWPLLVSTFGQDPEGEIYVSDFANGRIYQIVAPSK